MAFPFPWGKSQAFSPKLALWTTDSCDLDRLPS